LKNSTCKLSSMNKNLLRIFKKRELHSKNLSKWTTLFLKNRWLKLILEAKRKKWKHRWSLWRRTQSSFNFNFKRILRESLNLQRHYKQAQTNSKKKLYNSKSSLFVYKANLSKFSTTKRISRRSSIVFTQWSWPCRCSLKVPKEHNTVH
jgi:hypothetical protein